MTREKLADGGEKITTTRKIKQADGSIKTMTESKTVYPEVQTGGTTTKQVFNNNPLPLGNPLFLLQIGEHISTLQEEYSLLIGP